MFVANATAEATENTFNTVWTRGNACQVLCKYIYFNLIDMKQRFYV